MHLSSVSIRAVAAFTTYSATAAVHRMSEIRKRFLPIISMDWTPFLTCTAHYVVSDIDMLLVFLSFNESTQAVYTSAKVNVVWI